MLRGDSASFMYVLFLTTDGRMPKALHPILPQRLTREAGNMGGAAGAIRVSVLLWLGNEMPVHCRLFCCLHDLRTIGLQVFMDFNLPKSLFGLHHYHALDSILAHHPDVSTR